MSTRSRSNPGGARVLDMGEVRPFRERKPPWFKRPAPGGPAYRELRGMIEGQGLHTVCQEAACPNIGECWERGTATFMILGDTCTRRCGFCNVKTGKPTHNDPLEPLRVAQSVRKMGLRHAVITSVDRDDLPDLGASAFVGVIRSIRRMAPGCKVEVLTPDFRGEEMPLARVIAERPDVFNHNVETVPRLYPLARRGSRFLRSCRVLRNAKEMGGDEVVTKSGLMTGLGETKEELLETFGVLREHGVQVLTVGPVPAPHARPPAGGALLASRRVRRARARGVRDGLRVGRGRAARALELPRRADPGPGLRPARCYRRGDRSPPRLAWAPLPPRPRSSAPRSPPRGSAAQSTWSAASSRAARRTSAVERYDIGGDRWSRVRPMPLGAQPHDGGGLPRAGSTSSGGYDGAALSQPDRRAAPLQPARRIAGGGCRPRRPRARRTRAAFVGERLYVAGGANDSGSLRSLEIYDVARRRWSRGPDFPGPARNHTTGVASGGRFYVLAGRDSAQLRRRRALRPAPAALGARCRDMASRAAASPRSRLRDGRIVVFGGEELTPGGTTIGEVELFDPRTRRWRSLPDMRTPRHGLGGAALGNRVFALEGGPQPGLRLLERDRVPRRTAESLLASCLSLRDPAQGRHPHAPVPGRDRGR